MGSLERRCRAEWRRIADDQAAHLLWGSPREGAAQPLCRKNVRARWGSGSSFNPALPSGYAPSYRPPALARGPPDRPSLGGPRWPVRVRGKPVAVPRLRPGTNGRVSVMAAAYMTAAQQRLAGLWQRSRCRAAMPDAVVGVALSGAGWRRERALRTVTDTAVFTVNGPRGEPGVLKAAMTESSMAGLRRESEVLRQLWSDEQLGDWRAVLPVPLDAGNAGAGAFLLTSRLPGQVARDLPREAVSRLTPSAVDAISLLHRRTQTVRVVDETLLVQWVDQPAERIRMALPSNGVVGCLAGALRSDLAGRPLTLGWAHGDFHPGNVLVSADGRVTGIVDWGGAREQDLSVLDLAFWLLTVPCPGATS